MRKRTTFTTLCCLGASVLLTPAAALAQDEIAPAEQRDMTAARVVQQSLDAARAKNFNRWLSYYAPDVLVVVNGVAVTGRENLKAIYAPVFASDFRMPDILDSGWAGDRVYVLQREYYGDELQVEVYAEYEVTNGKISAVYARY